MQFKSKYCAREVKILPKIFPLFLTQALRNEILLVIFTLNVFNNGMTTQKTDQLYQKAMDAGANRDYKKAVNLLLELISLSDEYPEALLYLGRSYFVLGEQTKALGSFKMYLSVAKENPDAYFFMGRCYFSEEQYQKACVCFSRAIRLFPNHTPALSYLGLSLLKRKKPKLALPYLERAIALEPDNKRIFKIYVNGLFIDGIRDLSHEEYDMARQKFSFVIANGIDHISAYMYRARAYRLLGQYEEALDDYEELIKESPEDEKLSMQYIACLYEAGRTEDAEAWIGALKQNIPDLPEVQWDAESITRYSAYSSFQAKDYKTAFSLAIDVLKTSGGDAEMHAIAAESARNMGFSEKAVNHWRRACEMAKDNADFHYGLALCLWEQEEYLELRHELKVLLHLGYNKEIVRYFSVLIDTKTNAKREEDLIPEIQHLIRTFSPEPALMYALAEQYLKIGRSDLARGWFQKVLVVDESHEMSLLSLIAIEEAIGDSKSLSKSYDAYLSYYADNTVIRKEYIELLLKNKDFKNAAIWLETSFIYEGKTKLILRQLAYAQRESADYQEAAVIYRDLLKDDTKNTHYIRSLAFCLDKLGKTDIALSLMEKACSYIKKDAELLLFLGILLAKKGKTEKALDTLRKVLELNSDDFRAYKNIALIYEKQGQRTIAAQYFQQAEVSRKKIEKARTQTKRKKA